MSRPRLPTAVESPPNTVWPGARCTMRHDLPDLQAPLTISSSRHKEVLMSPSISKDTIPTTIEKTIHLDRTSVGTVNASQVTAHRSTVRRTDANQLDARQSITLVNRGHQANVHAGAVGAMAARSSQIRHSALGINISGNAKIENVATTCLVAGNIQADRVLSLTVFGGNISGNVHSLFGVRAAIAFGLTLGVSSLATRLIRYLLR